MGKGMNGINISCFEKNVVNYSMKYKLKSSLIFIVGHVYQRCPLLVMMNRI
jgi:hypothetical protein